MFTSVFSECAVVLPGTGSLDFIGVSSRLFMFPIADLGLRGVSNSALSPGDEGNVSSDLPGTDSSCWGLARTPLRAIIGEEARMLGSSSLAPSRNRTELDSPLAGVARILSARGVMATAPEPKRRVLFFRTTVDGTTDALDGTRSVSSKSS